MPEKSKRFVTYTASKFFFPQENSSVLPFAKIRPPYEKNMTKNCKDNILDNYGKVSLREKPTQPKTKLKTPKRHNPKS